MSRRLTTQPPAATTRPKARRLRITVTDGDETVFALQMRLTAFATAVTFVCSGLATMAYEIINRVAH